MPEDLRLPTTVPIGNTGKYWELVREEENPTDRLEYRMKLENSAELDALWEPGNTGNEIVAITYTDPEGPIEYVLIHRDEIRYISVARGD